MNERLEAEKVLMSNTLVELQSLLTQAELKMDILMNLEPMPIKAAVSLQKSINTACGIVDMVLAK